MANRGSAPSTLQKGSMTIEKMGLRSKELCSVTEICLNKAKAEEERIEHFLLRLPFTINHRNRDQHKNQKS